jgi:hypothetical protein
VRPSRRSNPVQETALVAQLGGTTEVILLACAGAREKDFPFSTPSAVTARAADYRATFFLLVQRDSDAPEVGALLQVDAFEVEIQKAAGKKTG